MRFSLKCSFEAPPNRETDHTPSRPARAPGASGSEDFWRYTPSGARVLAEDAGFEAASEGRGEALGIPERVAWYLMA